MLVLAGTRLVPVAARGCSSLTLERSGAGENGNYEPTGFSFSKEEGRRETQGAQERLLGGEVSPEFHDQLPC